MLAHKESIFSLFPEHLRLRLAEKLRPAVSVDNPLLCQSPHQPGQLLLDHLEFIAVSRTCITFDSSDFLEDGNHTNRLN